MRRRDATPGFFPCVIRRSARRRNSFARVSVVIIFSWRTKLTANPCMNALRCPFFLPNFFPSFRCRISIFGEVFISFSLFSSFFLPFLPLPLPSLPFFLPSLLLSEFFARPWVEGRPMSRFFQSDAAEYSRPCEALLPVLGTRLFLFQVLRGCSRCVRQRGYFQHRSPRAPRA